VLANFPQRERLEAVAGNEVGDPLDEFGLLGKRKSARDTGCSLVAKADHFCPCDSQIASDLTVGHHSSSIVQRTLTALALDVLELSLLLGVVDAVLSAGTLVGVSFTWQDRVSIFKCLR
jgi:hypothetical protein